MAKAYRQNNYNSKDAFRGAFSFIFSDFPIQRLSQKNKQISKVGSKKSLQQISSK